MTNSDSSKSAITLRGLKILEQIISAPSSQPTTFTNLYQQNNFNYNSLKSLLNFLENESYIEYLPHLKSYISGNNALDLSLKIFANNPLREKRATILAQLSEKVQETCNCSLFNEGNIIYLDRVEANWPVSISLNVGSRVPINCTASGKLILAYMSEKNRAQILKFSNLVHSTKNSIVDIESLKKECEHIRKNGFATDNEELFLDTVAISVPVFIKKNTALMAVAIQAPKFRQSVQSLKEFLPELKNTAENIQSLYRSDDK
jgi:DNA-binding IclR family transcriptional regulator